MQSAKTGFERQAVAAYDEKIQVVIVIVNDPRRKLFQKLSQDFLSPSANLFVLKAILPVKIIHRFAETKNQTRRNFAQLLQANF